MSLPMPSGSCWTKRTTESNRTAPEILRGFFAPYPPADASCRTSGHTPPNPLTAGLPATQAQTRTPQPFSPLSSPSPASPFPQGSPIQALLPPKRSPTRPALPYHAGTDPHNPAAQPAIFPVHQLPHSRTSLLSKPCSPKAKPDTPRTSLPRRHRHARPSRPACYLPRLPAPPFPHISPLQALLPPKRSPTRPALLHHAGTDTHGPAAQPAIFPVTNSPIPAHLSSSSDPYKNPGSRPPPGFFVISGSVRSPSQRRLR